MTKPSITFKNQDIMKKYFKKMLESIQLREDEFSIQATSTYSKSLFVRILKPNDNSKIFTITDFMTQNDEDMYLLIYALNKIFDNFGEFISAEFRFIDISPLFYQNGDKNEVIRRHNQIIATITEFVSKRGLRVYQSQLDAKHDKFDTLIKVEQ